MQNEKRMQAYSQSNFQDELKFIGDEMQTLRLGTSQHRRFQSDTGGSSLAGLFASPVMTDVELASRIESLEKRFSGFMDEIRGRTTSIEKDLETSLVVSEKRAKKLNEMYREASAENEALYDRFNLELGKIVRDVHLGETENALKSQLAAALEDIGRIKKENFRLKREVGGLRAQQAAMSLLKANER